VPVDVLFKAKIGGTRGWDLFTLASARQEAEADAITRARNGACGKATASPFANALQSAV
jgi:hypothetical protein